MTTWKDMRFPPIGTTIIEADERARRFWELLYNLHVAKKEVARLEAEVARIMEGDSEPSREPPKEPPKEAGP